MPRVALREWVMAEVLTICRLGPDWSVKDRSGAFWGSSPNRAEIEALAAKMAKRRGASVIVRNAQGAGRK